jgi:hypothetical protein
MSPHRLEEAPPEALRKEIFLALVEAQDLALVEAAEPAAGVVRSRRLIAERFGLTEGQVREIEQEGLDHEWPPL